MVPDARIIIGHGQMGEGELEDVMVKFIHHEADILVCTTIIECGLDIPNANTILINNADRFGLSELHQLRGRVGRWKHRAYCYLLLPADRPVTPVAAKRLKAIEEYRTSAQASRSPCAIWRFAERATSLAPSNPATSRRSVMKCIASFWKRPCGNSKTKPKPTRPDAHVEIGISAFLPRPTSPAIASGWTCIAG